jgi:hypothetical protein
MQREDTPSRGRQIRPLVSAGAVAPTDHPLVTVEDERRLPLEEYGTRRAASSRGSIEHHVRGILGEFAVAKYLGIPDQVDTEIYDDGDPGYDLRYRNQTIDVKTAGPQAQTPELWVNANRPLEADVYVLAQELNAGFYRLIGYAPRSQVARARERILDGGVYDWPDVVRAVPQADLYPLL